MRLKPYSNSLTGTWTRVNGDRYYSDPLGGLFVVTDGGADPFAGEASLDILRDYVGERILPSELPDADTLRDAVIQANDRLVEMATASCFEAPPVISATLAVVRDRRYAIAHVGSSRGYLARGGLLLQVTRDHTRAWEAFRRGELDKEDLAASPDAARLTRWLGNPSGVEPDVILGELLPGDRLVLCTDGLTRVLSEDELLQAIQGAPDPASICRAVFERAFERDDRDTVTVVAIALDEATPPPPDGAATGTNEAAAATESDEAGTNEAAAAAAALADQALAEWAHAAEDESPLPADEEEHHPHDGVGQALDDAVEALAGALNPEPPTGGNPPSDAPPLQATPADDTQMEDDATQDHAHRPDERSTDPVPVYVPGVDVRPEPPPLEDAGGGAQPPKERTSRPVKKDEIWGPPVPRRLVEDQTPPDTFFESNGFLALCLLAAIYLVVRLFLGT